MSHRFFNDPIWSCRLHKGHISAVNVISAYSLCTPYRFDPFSPTYRQPISSQKGSSD